MSQLGYREIAAIIPHRYPFLYIDRVIEFEDGKRIVAVKNVSINEPQFQGHFPGDPVMPGVLICEAMAQAGAILAFHSTDRVDGGRVMVLGGLDKARFRRPVFPGDQMQLEVHLQKRRRPMWKFDAVARVEAKVAAEAELSLVEVEREEQP